MPLLKKTENKRKGFTIIDTLIALVLFGLAVIVLGTMYPALRLSEFSQAAVVANIIAQKQMETLKSAPFQSLSDGQFSFQDSLLGNLESASAEYSVNTVDIDQDGTDDNNIKEVVVTINWQNNGTPKTHSLSSYIYELGVGK